jgi:hypothetical protein
MLSVTYKLFMLSVVTLNVVMLSVAAPFLAQAKRRTFSKSNYASH